MVAWIFLLPGVDVSVHIAGDGAGYHTLAENISQDKGFGLEVNGEGFVYEAFRTPGLPFILSLFMRLGYDVTMYLLVTSLLAAVCIPLCTWYIAQKLFTKEVGILSAFLVALEPLLIIHGWVLLTEIPFLITMLIGVCFLIRSVENKDMRSYNALCAGGALAASIYIRPAALLLLVVSFVCVLLYYFTISKKVLWQFVFVGGVIILLLTPWYVRTHELTGVYALSGTGWRNVYTDYLASVRALNKGTRFIDEKNALKRFAVEQFGITRSEINSPAQSELLKSYALPEILANKKTVVKIQAILFVSYFTHSDYQRRLQKFGILPLNKIEQGRKSSSLLLINQGIDGIPGVYLEMKNRYFIPIFERVWTSALFVSAIVGFFTLRTPMRFLFAILILLGYLTASAIGLGVEGRLRIPVLPFYFMLASCGMLFLHSKLRTLIFEKLWKK